MQPKKKPIGVIILGIFNLVVLGVIQLITFLIPQNWQAIEKMLKDSGINVNLSPALIKIMIVVQSAMSLIFIVCGAGLLLGKEWARKLTVYFAFAIAALVLLSVVLAPSSIQQAMLQIIYPGILIVYFTNKNIENFFKGK
ncbi:MAG: hypothetical protein M0R20_04400 [Candidatus Omnitrophica bacterium]|jgi:hypothetical protein|nr:hypothetical protein [Candidatus Omnitrophota bacterium]